MKFRQFTKAQRSSFPYWFNHWKAFNYVAFKLGHWRPRFLFHDIEKPWLMLFWKDYHKVQAWHREHNTHHLDNKRGKYDWWAMFIDWECSRYTKLDAQMTGWETLIYELDKHKDEQELIKKLRYNMTDVLVDLQYSHVLDYDIPSFTEIYKHG